MRKEAALWALVPDPVLEAWAWWSEGEAEGRDSVLTVVLKQHPPWLPL